MRLIQTHIRIISLLSIVCFFNSCTYYKLVEIPKDQPIPFDKKIIILHCNSTTMYLSDVKLVNNQLHGVVLSTLPYHEKPQELHIYTDFTIVPPESLPAKLSIPLTAIRKVEVYDVDIDKPTTACCAVAGGIAAVTVVVTVVAIVWAIYYLTHYGAK